MPLDPVSVEVVEDGQAGLGAGGLLPGGPVVRLGEAGAERSHCHHGHRLKLDCPGNSRVSAKLTLQYGTSADCRRT